MRYMLMIYGSDGAWKKLDQLAIDRIGARHKELQAELTASGELVAHNELSLSDAATVRTKEGKTVTARGPFTVATQMVGGFYVVDCGDIDRAIEIAGRFVEAEFASIEVRRLGNTTVWDAGAPGTKPSA